MEHSAYTKQQAGCCARYLLYAVLQRIFFFCYNSQFCRSVLLCGCVADDIYAHEAAQQQQHPNQEACAYACYDRDQHQGVPVQPKSTQAALPSLRGVTERQCFPNFTVRSSVLVLPGAFFWGLSAARYLRLCRVFSASIDLLPSPEPRDWLRHSPKRCRAAACQLPAALERAEGYGYLFQYPTGGVS